MPHYDSDGSTLVDEEARSRRKRRSNPRTYSSEEYSRRHSYAGEDIDEEAKRKARYEKMGKVAIVVGLLVGGIYEIYQKEKRERDAREREAYRRRRRREFERAKAARRRAEESLERQEVSESEDEYPLPPESRRLEYRPARARSRSREPRRLEAPPPGSGRTSRMTSRARSLDDVGYESDGRGISRHR